MLLDGYASLIHWLSPLTLGLSLLGLYIIIRENREMDKESRRLLCMYQVLCILMELYFSLAHVYYYPSPLPATAIVYSIASFIPAKIRTGMAYSFYGMTTTALYCIFFSRLQKIVVTDMMWLKLSRWQYRASILVVFSVYVIAEFVIGYLGMSETEGNFDQLLAEYPEYTEFLLHNRDRLIYYKSMSWMTITQAYMVVNAVLAAVLLQSIFLASCKAITAQRHVSKKTKQLQMKFLMGFGMQTGVPITILAIPSVFMNLSAVLHLEKYNDIINFHIVISSFHGSSNTLMMLLMSNNARKGAAELLSFGLWQRKRIKVSCINTGKKSVP